MLQTPSKDCEREIQNLLTIQRNEAQNVNLAWTITILHV